MVGNTENAKVAIVRPRETKLVSRSKLFFYIFSVFIFIFVVYYFAKIKAEIKLLERINVYWLTVAILAQLTTYLFTAIIYRLLLGTHGLRQSPRLWPFFQASIVSLFFNQTVPSAGISGNTFFFNFLVKRNIAVSQIITLILAELLIFYAAMEAIILVYLMACLFFYKVPSIFLALLAGGLIVYLGFGIVITLVGRKRSLDFFYKKLKRIKFIKKFFEKLNQRLQQQAALKRDAHLISYLKGNKKVVLKAFLFQLIIIGVDGFTLFALFYGLGVPVSGYVVLLSLTCTKIISILPFLPGSLILYESSMTFFFVSLGVPLGPAIVVTLLYRLLSFWLPIPVGLVLYRRWLHKSVQHAVTGSSLIIENNLS